MMLLVPLRDASSRALPTGSVPLARPRRARAVGSRPHCASTPAFADATPAAADRAPLGSVARSGESDRSAAAPAGAPRRAHPSSVCAPSTPESEPYLRSTTRARVLPASARTSAYVRWLRSPPAPARPSPRRTLVLLRSRAPGDAPPTRPSPHPASQSAGSAYANHTLQSSCARLLSSEPWFRERYQVYSAV